MKNFEKYYNEIKRRIKAKESADTDCLVYKLRTGKSSCDGKACYDCCIENIEWLNEDYQEPILDEEEKEIIKEMLDVILKFGCEVDYAIKEKEFSIDTVASLLAAGLNGFGIYASVKRYNSISLDSPSVNTGKVTEGVEGEP